MSLRVAVVGAGKAGRTHLAAFSALPDVEIVGVCDRIRDRAEAAAAQFGGRVSVSVSEMIQKERPNAISVCTAGAEGGSHHFQPVMEAVEAGIPTLCESPLSNQLFETRHMTATAQAKAVPLGVLFPRRFTPQAEKALCWLREGEIGTPLIANMSLWGDSAESRSAWSPLKTLAPHGIDLLRSYCGDIERIHLLCGRSGDSGGWSSFQMNLLFRSGAVGHLSLSAEGDPRLCSERCEVMGTEGRWVIENAYQRLTLYPKEADETRVFPNPLEGEAASWEAATMRQARLWAQAILAQTPLEKITPSGADALAAQEAIEAAIRSWEEDSIIEM